MADREVQKGIWPQVVGAMAGLAALVAATIPALAFDKVTFGLNWLADPEAGGYYQAVVDGTYSNYGLEVTILPGRPQSNGDTARRRQDRLLPGRRPARQLPRRGAQHPDRSGGRRFSEGSADLHVASGRGPRQMDRPAERRGRLCQRRGPVFLLRVDGEGVGIYPRQRQAL